MLLEINYTKPLNKNNTRLIKLEGINYVSDIEIDTRLEKIYIVTGSLTSEMYQYDFNFNRLSLSETCNIDFLKFPTEWGVITNIEIDQNTGIIYPIISTRWGEYGIATITSKDLVLDESSHIYFRDEITYTYNNQNFSYYSYHSLLNITTFDVDSGKLYIAPNSKGHNMKKIAVVDILGCAEGRGVIGNYCEKCEIGKYSDKIGQICKKCQPGYSSSIIESTLCQKCKPGKYTDHEDTIICNSCPAGYYTTEEASNKCKACKEGKYSLVTGSSHIQNCIDCDSGKISNKGSTVCNYCGIGKWAFEKKTCISCSKGKYSNQIGIISDNECKLCNKGKYSNEIGKVDEYGCKVCEIGRIGLIDGAISNTSCIKCERGKYRSNLKTCIECPNGWISSDDNDYCKICQVGKISDENGIDCLDCPAGRYNDLIGLSVINDVCKICPHGKYSSETGATNPQYCKNCQEGKFNSDEGLVSELLCKSCEAGKYRNNLRNPGQPCMKCAPGKYSRIESSSCITCGFGKYTLNDESLNTECLDCPTGRYNNNIGQHGLNNCDRCETGKYNNKIGSITINDCLPCNLGMYSETIGADSIITCKKCVAGKFNNVLGGNSITDCKECIAGTYSKEGMSYCTNCQYGKYTSSTSSIVCEDCSSGKYSDSLGNIICKDCILNSESNEYKTECICSAGSYMINNTEFECLTCKNEFICKKGTTIETLELKENYWRENKYTITTYKCKNTQTCIGGLLVNTTDNLCNDGHIGPICDICKEGWAKDDGVCLKCPENIGRTLSLTIIIPIICIMLIIFLIKTANPSDNKKEEVNGVVKIFMNYAQVFSLASSFKINWPTLIRYLFERAKEFSSPRVSFYSSDCAIGWTYYEKLIVYLALPLVYMIVVTIIIALMSLCFCHRKKKKMRRMSTTEEQEEYKSRKPTCLEFFTAWEKTAIVVGTFLSWPTIIEKTLEVINCEKIGNTYYLIKDLSVVCYDDTHLKYLIVAYISIILYGVGIPLLGFKLLYKYRYRLFDMQNRYDGSTPLSFLFLGYREKRWYYEFIIMGKKAGLILLSVFLRNHPRYQIIGASLLIQISFFLHVFLRPYDTITNYGMICNKLESVSLLSLVMTLSTGLFFGTVDSGYQLGTFEDILVILLIIANGGISLYFLIYFMVLTFKTIKTHLREHIQEEINKSHDPCYIKCCKESLRNRIKDWAILVPADNYGISLKNDLEKQIFTNFFIEKKKKLNILNSKIDGLSKKKLSVKLDRIRSEIQIIEKERCWQTIKNNRLYAELKRIVMLNKTNLTDQQLNELDDVFELYVQHGIDYNSKMNNLYTDELHGMIEMTENKDNVITL